MTQFAFVFPGQASQYVGMGEFLFRNFPKTNDYLEEADRALGFKLSDIIKTGPMEKLTQTEFCQPAILTVSVAFGHVLREKGINPAVLAGHSLGEYSALVHTKAMKFADAVRIVRLRGKYMQEAVPIGKGAMAAVMGLANDVVENICKGLKNKGVVEPANYNSPGQLVIAGDAPTVDEAMAIFKEKGAKLVTKLEVSAPFHSSLMKPAADRLASDLEKIELEDPFIPYVDNYSASVVTTASKIKDLLIKQIYNPVKWEQGIVQMKKEFHLTKVVEVGPKKVLSGLIKRVDKSLECITTDDEKALSELLEKGI
jgi:[acyl-carrier-protein] S-malonyltransferase